MAIITLNPLFSKVSGRAGNVVWYKRLNTQCIRSYIIPCNPNTFTQRRNRQSFAKAVKSWQALAEEEKNKYNRKARNLNMSGYNLYISDFMKERIPAGYKYNSLNIISQQRKIPSAGMLRFPSVSASLHLRFTFRNAVKPHQFSYG
ncbi:MAG: hypothetical protein V1874_08870 [Spirochaetota bacterium]